MIAYLRNLITHDFLLKFFSLTLAVLVWVTLSIAKEGGLGKRTSEETYHVPVSVVSGSGDVAGFKTTPSEVIVRVRGITRKLQELQVGDIRALVDLTGAEAPRGLRRRIGITTRPDITILEIQPEEVEITAPVFR